MRRLSLSSLALVATLAAPITALAATFFDLRVPASACRPIAAHVSKIKLSDGAWVYEAGQSGTVTLFCPLHIAQPSDTPDSVNIETMRLWYKDPDGMSTASRVSATLLRRSSTATTDSAIGGTTISSNSFIDTGFVIPGTTVGHVANFADFSYHAEISMFRQTSKTATPVFVGIDFEPAPQL